MIRSLKVLVALGGAAALLAACNPPACGPGTKQVQQANGDVRCVPADAISPQGIPCDVDGGATIIGGRCVSRTVCGQNTMPAMEPDGTIDCVGTGMGTNPCAACPASPGNGKICVTGQLYDFDTNAAIMPGGPTVQVGLFDPTAFLNNPDPSTAIVKTMTNKGCYTFDGVTTPSSGLVAIGVSDAATPATYALAGVGGTVASNTSYTIDAYRLALATTAMWKTSSGVDYDSTSAGAYVAFYYDDPVPDATQLTIGNETNPVVGVTLSLSPGTPMNLHYFDPDRLTVSGSDAASSTVGGAIMNAPVGLVTVSGTGGTCASGTCKWETHPGGSATGVVFIDRFHNCNRNTGVVPPSCM